MPVVWSERTFVCRKKNKTARLMQKPIHCTWTHTPILFDGIEMFFLEKKDSYKLTKCTIASTHYEHDNSSISIVHCLK